MTRRRDPGPERRLNLDIRVRGVRVHLHPTASPEHCARLKRMLRTLGDVGRLDLVRAVKAGALGIDEVWLRYRSGKLDELPTADLIRGLPAAWATWLAGKELRARTRQDYAEAMVRLVPFGPGAATAADLPTMLARYRADALGARGSVFSRDRRAVLAFLRSQYGPYHYLSNAAARVAPLKGRARAINPQTPDQVRALAAALAAQHARTLWGLCLTGMRPPSEFWEEDGARWESAADRITISGTKTRAAIRPVPKLGIITRPDTRFLAFRTALAAACDALGVRRVAPYDCRRTYSNWMVAAGVPVNRRRAYLGHSAGDVTTLYERPGDLARYLAEDAALLLTYIGATPIALRLVR